MLVATALAPDINAAETVPNPTVAGPTATGGARNRPFGAMTPAELAQSHFTEAEYFYSGAPPRKRTAPGAWTASGGETRAVR